MSQTTLTILTVNCDIPGCSHSITGYSGHAKEQGWGLEIKILDGVYDLCSTHFKELNGFLFGGTY